MYYEIKSSTVQEGGSVLYTIRFKAALSCTMSSTYCQYLFIFFEI